MRQEFDVVCLGGGVPEKRWPPACTTVGDARSGRFPAFNCVLGATIDELAAKTAVQHVA